ncbi:aspartate aminotransferase family protein (plasmid) [Macrococcoides bohemicum]|uniref:aspartate aminotransferase family protein n=1 Tax=Macrococcoides bohemicum TaxID=1903056 RepID=UPI003B00FFB5
MKDDNLSIVWEKAEGCRVYDVDGNEFIDFASGLNVANVGHKNKKVVESIHKQSEKLIHGMGDFHTNNVKADFLNKLASISPIKDCKIITSVNGSDAVDSAMKTANLYTGKSKFISFYGAYHGMGPKSLEVTARHHFRDPYTKELNSNTIFLPYPYTYRPPFSNEININLDDQINLIINLIESTISNTASGANDIAAIIIEPIQGRGGVVQAPKEFMKSLRNLCDKYNILLIVDEILSGFGRSGEWFAINHSEVIPDIMTIGKGLSGGFPISAMIGKKNIVDGAWSRFEGESIHTSTFQGNPIGCAMSLASIDYIIENDLIKASKEKGEYFINQLKNELSSYEIIGEIRGSGLMIGIEIVKNAHSKEPDPEKCWDMMRFALNKGILLLNGGHEVNTICLTPPLTISKDEIDYCIKILKEYIEL